jgi:peptidoglycan/LPS O-acetylase OafA/YrhL
MIVGGNLRRVVWFFVVLVLGVLFGMVFVTSIESVFHRVVVGALMGAGFGVLAFLIDCQPWVKWIVAVVFFGLLALSSVIFVSFSGTATTGSMILELVVLLLVAIAIARAN